MSDWSSALYLRFEEERSRPARDLLAQVPLSAARSVVDLGCGPGNSTALLAARFPGAGITGVDTSPDMLAAARKRLPGLTFVAGDAATFVPAAPPDLIFANALFQWVPDHLGVLVRLLATLAPGGVLAVHMPDNLDEPSHRLMRETAADGPWAARFAGPVAREKIHSPGEYYDALRPAAARVDIWHTLYNHPLAGPDAIIEWLKSTGLRPYLAKLDPAEAEAWLAAYRQRLAEAYPTRADGSVLLRFPRLFMVAVKA